MKKQNSFHQTQTKSSRPEVVSIFAAFIIISRILYIPFLGDNDIQGDFLQYKWLSSFLYSIGMEFSYLSFAFLLAYSTNSMYPEARKTYMNLAYGIAFVGMFFTSWILLESEKTNPLKEMIFSFIASGLSIYLVLTVSKFIKTSNNKYIAKIRMLVDVLILKAPDYVKDKGEWKSDVVEPTLDRLNE